MDGLDELGDSVLPQDDFGSKFKVDDDLITGAPANGYTMDSEPAYKRQKIGENPFEVQDQPKGKGKGKNNWGKGGYNNRGGYGKGGKRSSPGNAANAIPLGGGGY